MNEPPALIFFDVDTQVDFLLPVGALYVAGGEKLIPRLARLTAFAAGQRIPIISTADAHAPQDPEFNVWPPHCVAGTLGQRKVAETLLIGAIAIANASGPLPDAWQNAPQVIVEKQTTDVFQTQTIRQVVDAYRGRRFVVYGVVTEVCVLCAVRGLLQGGAQVDVLTDAIRELDAERGREALRELELAGARLTTAAAQFEV